MARDEPYVWIYPTRTKQDQQPTQFFDYRSAGTTYNHDTKKQRTFVLCFLRRIASAEAHDERCAENRWQDGAEDGEHARRGLVGPVADGDCGYGRDDSLRDVEEEG